MFVVTLITPSTSLIRPQTINKPILPRNDLERQHIQMNIARPYKEKPCCIASVSLQQGGVY
jgi:hypothetical protein